VRHPAARLLRSTVGALALVACAPAVAPHYAPSPSERARARDEIVAMLASSAASWNRGDLDAFVADYLPGAETTYIGSRGVLRGPAAIRAAYAPRFAPGGVRDSLSFELVDVDPLAPDVLNVIATYILARHVDGRDSVTARGPTSLVMRREDRRRRIVHDPAS
jgi:ketosteroid isomerase-like protein